MSDVQVTRPLRPAPARAARSACALERCVKSTTAAEAAFSLERFYPARNRRCELGHNGKSRIGIEWELRNSIGTGGSPEDMIRGRNHDERRRRIRCSERSRIVFTDLDVPAALYDQHRYLHARDLGGRLVLGPGLHVLSVGGLEERSQGRVHLSRVFPAKVARGCRIPFD